MKDYEAAQQAEWAAFGKDEAACLGTKCNLAADVVGALAGGGWVTLATEVLPCVAACTYTAAVDVLTAVPAPMVERAFVAAPQTRVMLVPRK